MYPNWIKFKINRLAPMVSQKSRHCLTLEQTFSKPVLNCFSEAVPVQLADCPDAGISGTEAGTIGPVADPSGTEAGPDGPGTGLDDAEAGPAGLEAGPDGPEAGPIGLVADPDGPTAPDGAAAGSSSTRFSEKTKAFGGVTSSSCSTNSYWSSKLCCVSSGSKPAGWSVVSTRLLLFGSGCRGWLGLVTGLTVDFPVTLPSAPEAPVIVLK